MKAKRQNVIPIERVKAMGTQFKRAHQIATLGKIVSMKAKMFAENPENAYAQDLDYVLSMMQELETFLK